MSKKVNKSGEVVVRVEISIQDKLDYRGMFGDEGAYYEMLSWSNDTPIRLYKTKEYKQYGISYLKVILSSLTQHRNLSRGVGSVRTSDVDQFKFIGKNGIYYKGTWESSKEFDIFDVEEVGGDHLQEFLDWYAYSVVVSYIEEDLDELGTKYRDYLWKILLVIVNFQCRKGISKLLGIPTYGGTIKTVLLMEMVQKNVDKYFESYGKHEDPYTNKWYRELQDRVLAELKKSE